MAEVIGFENGRNSNFQGLVTLTLDPAIRHTIVHHLSTSTYIPNFIQIKETFCGRTDVRTDIFPPILLGWLLEVDLKRTDSLSSPAITPWKMSIWLWIVRLSAYEWMLMSAVCCPTCTKFCTTLIWQCWMLFSGVSSQSVTFISLLQKKNNHKIYNTVTA